MPEVQTLGTFPQPTAHTSDADVPHTPWMFWVVPLATLDQTSWTGGVGPLESPPHPVRSSGARAQGIRRRALILYPAKRSKKNCTVFAVMSNESNRYRISAETSGSFLTELRLDLSECRPRMEMTKMPDLDRRRFFGAAAATFAASQLGLLVFPRRLQAMTQPIAEGSLETSNVRSDIRPFRVSVPEEQLADLRQRVKATKWPERETVADDTQGVQLATV